MKIAVTSDTLGLLPIIKGDFDLFIHCGNFCPLFDYESITMRIDEQLNWIENSFNTWLKSINAKYKILIAGNSDLAVQRMERDIQWHMDTEVLFDEAITIQHKIVYGMNWLPLSDDKKSYLSSENIGKSSAFISRNHEHFFSACAGIPDKTDILVTRLPPYGILDEISRSHIGSDVLLTRTSSLKNLRLHAFGLASDQGGQQVRKNKIIYTNAFVKGYMEIEL